MRIRIAHRNVCRYEPPATGVNQLLRLTPRNHEGQYVVRWRTDVSADARLAAHEDAFGNITHVFSADGPFAELTLDVDGEVETQNTEGVVRGTVERFAPSLFLRDTALTQADSAIGEFARNIRADSGGEVLAALHGLLDRLFAQLRHDAGDAADAAGTATAAEPLPTSAARRATWPISSSASRTASDPGPRCRRLSSSSCRQRDRARRPCLGGSLRARSRLGRLRPGQRGCAQARRIYASPSGSMRWAPRRCAARITVPAPRRWKSPSKSGNRDAHGGASGR